MLRLGIEQEFVFRDEAGRYLDADTAKYSEFSRIVDAFPAFGGDDAFLDCKSLERFPKRCYVEGFELHDADGRPFETLPKGLEIRTLPHAGVEETVAEFRRSYAELMRLAGEQGMSPVLTSHHPFKTDIPLDARIGRSEHRVRSAAELAVARQAMVSHGLHVTISLEQGPAERLQDLVGKVNHYAAALIPWSFSSPFRGGRVFKGLCARNYYRVDRRRLADLRERRGARLLEFRGFDACGDARLLTALLSLYCGFLLDESLPGRAAEQDAERLKRSSLLGFGDPSLREEGARILAAARAALGGPDESWDVLEAMLRGNDSHAHRMKRRHAETGPIMDCITGRYDY